MNPTIYSWTASHIDCLPRLDFLDMMLESLERANVNYKQISLTYEPKFKEEVNKYIKKFMCKYTNLSILINEKNKMPHQFEIQNHANNVLAWDLANKPRLQFHYP